MVRGWKVTISILAVLLVTSFCINSASAQGIGVVDNNDPNFRITGTWDIAPPGPAAPGYYAKDYRWTVPFTNGEMETLDIACWDAELSNGAGNYAVFVWYPIHITLATNVPVTIDHAGVSNTVFVNERTNGGKWVSLGVYYFNASGGGAGRCGGGAIREEVSLSNNANSYVVADAVMFKYSPAWDDGDGIVDNIDPNFSVIGNWGSYSTPNADIYGPDYRYHAAGPGEDKAVWDAELINGPGRYRVMVWYPAYEIGRAHV